MYDKYAIGTKVALKITPKDGYAVARVLFNGIEVEKTDGKYVVVIGKTNQLNVEYKSADEIENKSDKNADKGCGGVVGMGGIGLTLFAVASLAFGLFIKMKQA